MVTKNKMLLGTGVIPEQFSLGTPALQSKFGQKASLGDAVTAPNPAGGNAGAVRKIFTVLTSCKISIKYFLL